MKSITRNTAAQAYRALFSFMLDHGEYYVSEDGAPCLIAPGRETIIVHINHPLDESEQLVNLSPLGAGAMEAYARQLVYGENTDGFDYTYWERIHEYAPEGMIYDQYDHVIELLNSSGNTRRGVITIWEPGDCESKHPPCLNHIKLNIWNKCLNMTCLFRSHDLVGGWIPNVYALINLLSVTAVVVGVYPGWLEVISEDGHFYKNDQDKIDKIKQKLGIE